MAYPDVINLPFNGASIREQFTAIKPEEKGPEGPGFWAIMQKNALVVTAGEDGLSLPEGDRPDWLLPAKEPICIGLWHGRPLRAAAIDKEAILPPPFTAESLNAIKECLDDRLLTLGGLAHQVLQWERQSAVCSRCGGDMAQIWGSWGKKCLSCHYEHYPHIHPCVIVLIKRGEEFLLARKAEWPKGRYSLVAGFVDFGESLEECVHREVEEEVGIKVKNIRYVGSQSWPFPSQLMTGFVADYAGGVIQPDGAEIEDARWFCCQDMPEALPARRSIARWIIDRFALRQRL